MYVRSLRDQIPALSDRVYLNTGTSGPVPLGVFQAEVDLLRRFSDEGYCTPAVAAAYNQALTDARKAVAELIGCDAAQIALVHSTSEGVGTVAQGIDWKPGDEIITSDLEHLSGIAPWLDVAARHGVRVVRLQSEDGHLTVDAFRNALSERTRLICVSHISWATGAVLPVKEICQLSRASGVFTLIDGAQSAGHLPIDVKEIGCDFYTVSGQKWLLGPEGTGALYVSQEALERLHPSRIGWASLASHDMSLDTLDFHPDARRFEVSTLHAPAFAGLARAIAILEHIGLDRVFERARSLATLARERLAELSHVSILSPTATSSGLLTFKVEGIAPDEAVRRLWNEHRVIIRSIPPLGALRASFHVFNTEDDVAALVRGIEALR